MNDDELLNNNYVFSAFFIKLSSNLSWGFYFNDFLKLNTLTFSFSYLHVSSPISIYVVETGLLMWLYDGISPLTFFFDYLVLFILACGFVIALIG